MLEAEEANNANPDLNVTNSSVESVVNSISLPGSSTAAGTNSTIQPNVANPNSRTMPFFRLESSGFGSSDPVASRGVTQTPEEVLFSGCFSLLNKVNTPKRKWPIIKNYRKL